MAEDTPITHLSSSVRRSTCSSVSSAGDEQNLDIKNEKKKVKRKVIYFWNCSDVNKWLRKHCGQFHNLYGELFRAHEINGKTLVRLSDCKLQTLGITNPAHREELMRHILRLRLKTEAQELRTLDSDKELIKARNS